MEFEKVGTTGLGHGRPRLLRRRPKRTLVCGRLRNGRRLPVWRDLLEHSRLGALTRVDLPSDGRGILHWLRDCCIHSPPPLLQTWPDQHLRVLGPAVWATSPQNGGCLFLVEQDHRGIVSSVLGCIGAGCSHPRTFGGRARALELVHGHHRIRAGHHLCVHPQRRDEHCDLDRHPSNGMHASGCGAHHWRHPFCRRPKLGQPPSSSRRDGADPHLGDGGLAFGQPLGQAHSGRHVCHRGHDWSRPRHDAKKPGL